MLKIGKKKTKSDQDVVTEIEPVIKEKPKKRKPYERICSICRELIDTRNEDHLYSDSYMHTECFINKEKNKGTSDDVIDEKIKIMKNILIEKQNKKNKKDIEVQKVRLSNTKDKIVEYEDKDKFFKWVFDAYDLTGLPKITYMKIANINTGVYKGLKEGISYSDLLYMFQTKKNSMDKTASYKESKGQGFKDNTGRFLYDLAVIINQYDDYRAWKNKQKLLEAEKINEEKEKQKIIDYGSLAKTKYQKPSEESNDEIDIGDIMNELY